LWWRKCVASFSITLGGGAHDPAEEEDAEDLELELEAEEDEEEGARAGEATNRPERDRSGAKERSRTAESIETRLRNGPASSSRE